tara:strand:- start:132 stop:635 length:504 start_codon:yes stop_codon:yes gene_type:complete
MATALFISREDLVRNTIINGTVDSDKFLPFVKLAQIQHIQNYLGSKLYDKISQDILDGSLTGDYQTLVNEYVQPALIHFAMVDFLPFSAFEIKNGGIFKHSSETATQPSKDEVDYLVQKHRNFAEFYTRRMIDFLTFNAPSKYPEYYTNQNEDMYPDKSASFVGWVL